MFILLSHDKGIIWLNAVVFSCLNVLNVTCFKVNFYFVSRQQSDHLLTSDSQLAFPLSNPHTQQPGLVLLVGTVGSAVGGVARSGCNAAMSALTKHFVFSFFSIINLCRSVHLYNELIIVILRHLHFGCL